MRRWRAGWVGCVFWDVERWYVEMKLRLCVACCIQQGGDRWDYSAGASQRSSSRLLQGLLGRFCSCGEQGDFLLFLSFFLSCFFFFVCLVCLFDVFVTPFCLGAELSLAEGCLKASLVAAGALHCSQLRAAFPIGSLEATLSCRETLISSSSAYSL